MHITAIYMKTECGIVLGKESALGAWGWREESH